MKKFLCVLLTAIMLLSLTAAASFAEKETVRVAMVTDTGGINDQSFNALAWAGLQKAQAELEVAKQNAYTTNVEKIMASIAPELIAAMTSTSNAQLMETVAKAMSPVAMARGESVAETTNLLLRGTPLEGMIADFVKKSAE